MMKEEEELQKKDNKISIINYVILLVKHKQLISIITLVVTVIAIIVSLVSSPIYRAETKILPSQPDRASMKAQLVNNFGGLSGLRGNGPIIKTASALYTALLTSKPILDGIIDKFNLIQLYESESRDGARKKLSGVMNTSIARKSRIITIGVEDKDPKMAAKLANVFADELKNYIKGIAISEASQKRLFFEEQLKDAKLALIKAEEAVKEFQEKTGTMKIESQAAALISSIAKLRAQIALKEVEIKVMKAYATKNNPALQTKQAELQGLKEELEKIEIKGEPHNSGTLMQAGRVPGISLEHVRKIRDLKFNESLYEFLLKQYEAAKIEELSSATIIQVIEKATPPVRRIRPERMQMIIRAFFIALFFSIAVVFLMDHTKKMFQDTGNKERLNTLRKYTFQVNVSKDKLDTLKKYAFFWRKK